MSIDTTPLIQAYLTNIQVALENQQTEHAELLLRHTLELFPPANRVSALEQPFPLRFSLGVGLNHGIWRQGDPNQDYTFAVTDTLPLTGESFALMIVADGMGGHVNGQEASRIAVHAMVDDILPKLYQKQRQEDLGDVMTQAVQKANADLHARNGAATSVRKKMGTTISAALILDKTFTVANVGDSRAYRYRHEDGLRQITRDHSLVQERIERGELGADDRYTHPDRHMITRHVGASATITVDVFRGHLRDGDILLLCSDGLWEMTRDHRIETIMRNLGVPAEQIAAHLVQLALQGGGQDNIGLCLAKMSVLSLCETETLILKQEMATATVL